MFSCFALLKQYSPVPQLDCWEGRHATALTQIYASLGRFRIALRVSGTRAEMREVFICFGDPSPTLPTRLQHLPDGLKCEEISEACLVGGASSHKPKDEARKDQ